MQRAGERTMATTKRFGNRVQTPTVRQTDRQSVQCRLAIVWLVISIDEAATDKQDRTAKQCGSFAHPHRTLCVHQI